MGPDFRDTTDVSQLSPALWWSSRRSTLTPSCCSLIKLPSAQTALMFLTLQGSGGWTAKMLMSAMCEEVAWAFSATRAEWSTVGPSQTIADTLSPAHLVLISKAYTNTHIYTHTCKETGTHRQTLLQRSPQENPSQLLNFRHDWGQHTCPGSISTHTTAM